MPVKGSRDMEAEREVAFRSDNGRAHGAIVLYDQIMKGLWGMATPLLQSRRKLVRALGLGAIATVLIAAGCVFAQDTQPIADQGNPTVAERPFIHPGLLHTGQDINRMQAKVAARAEPWLSGWERLIANPHSSLKWNPRPVDVIFRGNERGHAQNYPLLYNDIAVAYACALRWHISGDRAYADKAVEIMNAWSSALKRIDGTSDKFLASGIYGYQFANAAELMRTYRGWSAADFARFQSMMLDVFYPMNHDFLERHNGARIDHYWCNWDACNMASELAIGVLCDRRAIYNDAVDYFKHGKGNGAIEQAVVRIYPGNLGQWQESGRDQGHSCLGIALLGAVCEMAWNQGDDLYGYDNNRFLAGAEYVAKYNLGYAVPYTTYKNSDVTQPVISQNGRGDLRPNWEMVYNHYVNRRGLAAPYSALFAQKVRPEGGGGDYGSNSGGFDQLGYGTLTFTLDASH
jgi:hypothetical protein